MVITSIFISAIIYLVIVQGPLLYNLIFGIGGIVGLILSVLSLFIVPKERAEAPPMYKLESILRKGEYINPQFLREDPAWVDFEYNHFYPHPKVPELISLLETPWPFKGSSATQLGKKERSAKAPHLYVTGPPSTGKTILMKQLGFQLAQKQRGLFRQSRPVYLVEFKTLPPEADIIAGGIDRLLAAIKEDDSRFQYLFLDDVHLNPRLANSITKQLSGSQTALIYSGRLGFQDHYPANETEFLRRDRLSHVIIELDRIQIQNFVDWFSRQTNLNPELQPRLDELQRECGNDLWLLGQLLLYWLAHPEHTPTVDDLYHTIANHIRVTYRANPASWTALICVAGYFQYEWGVPQDYLTAQAGMGLAVETIEGLKQTRDLTVIEDIEARDRSRQSIELGYHHSSKARHWFGAGLIAPDLCQHLRDIIDNRLSELKSENLIADLVQTYILFCTRTPTIQNAEKVTHLLLDIGQNDVELLATIIELRSTELKRIQEACTPEALVFGWAQIYRFLNQRDKALEICSKALKLKEFPEAYDMQGTLYYETGHAKSCLEANEKAFSLAVEQDNKKMQISALDGIGWILAVLGQIEEAIKKHKAASEILQGLSDPMIEAQHLNAFATTLANAEQHEESLEKYQRALEIMEEIGDRRGYASYLANTAITMIKVGRLDKATDAAYRAFYELKERGHIHNAALALGNIAMVHFLKGELEEGVDVEQKVHQLLLEAKSKTFASIRMLIRTRALIELGRFDEAHEILEAEIKENEELDEPWMVAWALSLISYLELLQGKSKVALKTIKKAYAKAEHEPLLKASQHLNVLWIWGKVLIDLEQHEAALAKLYQGQKEFKAFSPGILISDYLTDIGFALLGLSRFDEAEQQFLKAQETAERLKAPYILVRVYYGLALMHLRLNQYTQALSLVAQSLQLSEKMKLVPFHTESKALQTEIQRAMNSTKD